MKKQAGFTLAEVLITLGIIGVVATITIPNLMTQIQDRQFKEAAKAAYSKASQAVQQMKSDEGGSLSSYYSMDYSFEPVFMNYFKVAQDCGKNLCVENLGYTTLCSQLYGTTNYCYKELKGSSSGVNANSLHKGQFITADGMFWGIGNDGNGKIYITVDVNNFEKGPNVYGRDVFMFQLLNDVLLPMGASNTNFPASTYCSGSFVSYNGFGCMEYVMEGKDY